MANYDYDAVQVTMAMSLQEKLIAFIASLNLDAGRGLTENTSLIRSGLLDSSALLQLAEWVEREVGSPLDLASLDLMNEWDTVAAIEAFIRKQQPRKGN